VIPNRTPPISSAAAVETLNVRPLKSPSGSSGSATRRSMTANAARPATPMTAAAITSTESHA
jgi:hypothetical protein